MRRGWSLRLEKRDRRSTFYVVFDEDEEVIRSSLVLRGQSDCRKRRALGFGSAAEPAALAACVTATTAVVIWLVPEAVALMLDDISFVAAHAQVDRNVLARDAICDLIGYLVALSVSNVRLISTRPPKDSWLRPLPCR
jgi:hypothetical protein